MSYFIKHLFALCNMYRPMYRDFSLLLTLVYCDAVVW